MTTRTREITVTFKHPFKLSVLDRHQPAGTYRLVVDEEEIPDITFLAYRRSATMLHIPAIETSGGSSEVFMVGSEELAKALEVDLRT